MGRNSPKKSFGVNLHTTYLVNEAWDGLLQVGYDAWQQTLQNIRRLKDHLWGDKIDSRLITGPNGEPALEVQASFGSIVKVLKQYYCYGISAFGYNPKDHPGGMEFRDCHSSPGFYFKLAYTKTGAIGFSYKTGLPTKYGMNEGVSWITDFHMDRYNPNHSVWDALRHLMDFIR